MDEYWFVGLKLILQALFMTGYMQKENLLMNPFQEPKPMKFGDKSHLQEITMLIIFKPGFAGFFCE